MSPRICSSACAAWATTSVRRASWVRVTGHQGAGFLIGLRTTRPAKEIQAELLECGILAGTATDPNILRLLPPFILQEEQVDMLRDTLADLPA